MVRLDEHRPVCSPVSQNLTLACGPDCNRVVTRTLPLTQRRLENVATDASLTTAAVMRQSHQDAEVLAGHGGGPAEAAAAAR